VVKALLRQEELFSHRFSVASSLMCACKRGHLSCVEALIQDVRVPLDIVNKEGLGLEEVINNRYTKKQIICP